LNGSARDLPTVREPVGPLLRRQLVLRVNREERLGVRALRRDLIALVLIDATHPDERRRRHDAVDGADAIHVANRKRLNQRHLVRRG
jgi:hypothetical protein